MILCAIVSALMEELALAEKGDHDKYVVVGASKIGFGARGANGNTLGRAPQYFGMPALSDVGRRPLAIRIFAWKKNAGHGLIRPQSLRVVHCIRNVKLMETRSHSIRS
jgi:hypothetical protein